MSSRILIADLPTGRLVRAFVVQQCAALALGRRVKAILDSAQYGSPADWSAVALELGLSGADANQKAQDAWSIISTAMAAIDVAAVAELERMDQG